MRITIATLLVLSTACGTTPPAEPAPEPEPVLEIPTSIQVPVPSLEDELRIDTPFLLPPLEIEWPQGMQIRPPLKVDEFLPTMVEQELRDLLLEEFLQRPLALTPKGRAAYDRLRRTDVFVDLRSTESSRPEVVAFATLLDEEDAAAAFARLESHATGAGHLWGLSGLQRIAPSAFLDSVHHHRESHDVVFVMDAEGLHGRTTGEVVASVWPDPTLICTMVME